MYMYVCIICDIILLCVEEAKSKKDKPDTFVEKLVTNLLKNLVVSAPHYHPDTHTCSVVFVNR